MTVLGPSSYIKRMRKRAVSEREKRDKEQSILAAVVPLFAENSFEEISMARIAEAAQVAKGTLFLYFSTKEELFLRLMESSYAEWTEELLALLSAVEEGGRAVEQVADALLLSLKGREDLLRLLAILHTRIEANISLEAAIGFKRGLVRSADRIALQFSRIFPVLGREGAREGVNAIYMLIVGATNFCSPAPIIRTAIEVGGFDQFPTRFEPEFRRLVHHYLHGLLTVSTKADSSLC